MYCAHTGASPGVFSSYASHTPFSYGRRLLASEPCLHSIFRPDLPATCPPRTLQPKSRPFTTHHRYQTMAQSENPSSPMRIRAPQDPHITLPLLSVTLGHPSQHPCLHLCLALILLCLGLWFVLNIYVSTPIPGCKLFENPLYFRFLASVRSQSVSPTRHDTQQILKLLLK